MQVKEIKQYIMSVLIKNSEKLVISPDLVIDRLFDSLSLSTIQNIEGYATGNTALSDDVKQLVWDRYLMPRLCMADHHVKVFAR